MLLRKVFLFKKRGEGEDASGAARSKERIENLVPFSHLGMRVASLVYRTIQDSLFERRWNRKLFAYF